MDVAWTTSDITNFGSGSATVTSGSPAQPTQIGFLADTAATTTVCVGGAGVGCPSQALGRPVANPDGSFTKAALKPIPASGVTGSGLAVIEGRPAVDTDPDPAVRKTALDTLLKALLQVSLSNYEASGFVLNPADWFGAMLLKDTTGRYLFSDPQSMVAPRVWAKPVVASQTMPAGKFLAGAFNLGAQIWDREDATIRISENVDDHFIRNMVAILAEERLAFTVYRTTAFVYGNTSHAG